MKPPADEPATEPAAAATAGVGEGPGEAPPERDSRLTRAAMLLPVLGAPAGLLFAILASLMISGWRVQHSAIVQVDPQWRAGEALALRVHVQTGEGAGMPDARVRATLRRGEQSAALAELTDATGNGGTQATVTAPTWDAGPAELELAIEGMGQSFVERVPVTLVGAREARRGTVTISTSVKNWSDDTDPQPERLRVALRPLGRLAAGFANTLLVRVTDPEGKPHVGPIEVLLLDGEFGSPPVRGGEGKVIASGDTDAQGLLRFEGELSTDVVRFEVRVLAPPLAEVATEGCSKCEVDSATARAKRAADAKRAGEGAAGEGATASGEVAKAAGEVDGKPGGAGVVAEKPGAGEAAGKPGAGEAGKPGAGEAAGKPGAADEVARTTAAAPLGVRKFRLVSFAGAVRVAAEPLAVRSGSSLTIDARALRAKKVVYVDLHGPDGAWVDTLAPITGPEPPRVWSTSGLQPGFLQIEAYQFTTAPGESAALARVQITEGEPDTDAALAPLFEQQRALMSVGRVEKGFDRELERKYLDIVERAVIPSVEVPLARAWLLGTLPIEVLGPPVALTTLPREQADLALRKSTWANGLRWFLLGGGGLFLLATLLLIVISHRRAAAKLTGEIHGEGATAEIAHEIVQAQRAVLLRAVALVVTMALALVLTVVVLDKLLWSA